MGNDDADEAEDGAVRVFADDDEGGTGDHGKDVDEEEGVGKAPWDYMITELVYTNDWKS